MQEEKVLVYSCEFFFSINVTLNKTYTPLPERKTPNKQNTINKLSTHKINKDRLFVPQLAALSVKIQIALIIFPVLSVF